MSAAPSTGTLRFRPAAPDECDAVADLVQSAYRGDSSRRGWTTEADLLDGRRTDAQMVRDLIASPDDVVLVGDAGDDGVVACCHLQHRGDSVYLGMFAVRPELQGHGLGSAVLAAAEEHARSQGVARLEITVLNHRPELHAWYTRKGFEMTGETVPFPYGDERFGVPRRDDLLLLAMAKDLGGAPPQSVRATAG